MDYSFIENYCFALTKPCKLVNSKMLQYCTFKDRQTFIWKCNVYYDASFLIYTHSYGVQELKQEDHGPKWVTLDAVLHQITCMVIFKRALPTLIQWYIWPHITTPTINPHYKEMSKHLWRWYQKEIQMWNMKDLSPNL